MALIKNTGLTGLVLVFVVFATSSLALLTPYEIVNSISLETGNTSPSDSLSKYDFNDDEFTGDAVPVLVNTDTAYVHP
jgi:hypothetical protein